MTAKTNFHLPAPIPKPNRLPSNEQGLTLVESVVSLLIFFIAMAGIIPIFLNYSLATINNEKRTAAIALTGQVLDGLRQTDTDTLPSSGTVTMTPITYMGKTYTPTITYCQTTTYCDANSRHVKVQIAHNNQSVYETETVFNKFE
ncbi:MAG: type II secretion system protein [Acaryochloridaceae cyanobacterium SU_2_1]|nr:type II secretion system protein [Acaryochloridaceae cyanobacterium SU_2_1]